MTDASLSARFEENRPRLRAVAYRILGSTSETEDAMQETWLRIARTEGTRSAVSWPANIPAACSPSGSGLSALPDTPSDTA